MTAPGEESKLIQAAEALRETVEHMCFREPVSVVYNPLVYAWRLHRDYLARYGQGRKRVLFLGMNPGPFGMAQVGVPFGEVTAVYRWLQLRGEVDRPQNLHPRRPVEGFACRRSEVSGRRLWGLFAERFGTPAHFFQEHFVANYCPLMFLEASGRNRTPDKLPVEEKGPLTQACDLHLRRVVDALQCKWVVGVGAYAEQCAQRVFSDGPVAVCRILHPSPASPAANRGWAAAATEALVQAGVWS